MRKGYDDNFLTQYIPIPDGEENEVMEIKIIYGEGGINYFTYKNEDRGLFLHMTPVVRERTKYGWSTQRTLMDDRGRKVLLLKMKRRSKQKGEHMAQLLTPLVPHIADMAMTQNWGGVVELLRREVGECV